MGMLNKIASELLVKGASDDALLKMFKECSRKNRQYENEYSEYGGIDDEGGCSNNVYRLRCIMREIQKRGLAP